jgi:hypothetical protein
MAYSNVPFDASSPLAAFLQRSPHRISVTMPQALHDWIHEQASLEGRSASNLCAHLLEMAREHRRANGHG